jgi:hypothetical protein
MKHPVETVINLRGEKKEAKVFANEKNLNYPPKEYGHFIRKTVLEYYNKKILGALY